MLDVKDILSGDYVGKKVTVCGWVRNHRKQKSFILFTLKIFL